MTDLNLYEDDEYRAAIAELWDIAIKHNGSCPLVPWIGDIYSSEALRSGLPKVVWCGIAADGWGDAGSVEDRSIQSAAKGTRSFLLSEVDKYRFSSGFWRVLTATSAMLCGLYQSGMPPEAAVGGGMVWTNAYKVGGAPSGNPTGSLEKAQREASAVALRREIACLQPRITVFHTGDSANGVMNIWPGWEHWTKHSQWCWSRSKGGMLEIWLSRSRALSVNRAVDEVRWAVIDWLREAGRETLTP